MQLSCRFQIGVYQRATRMPTAALRLLSLAARSRHGSHKQRSVAMAAYQEVHSSASQVYEDPIGQVEWDPSFANSLTLIGTLGSDVDHRQLSGGKVVSNFRMAVQQGSRRGPEPPKTMWMDVESWDDLALAAAETLHKGMQVHVMGRLKVDQYPHRDHPGVTMTKPKIVATKINMVARYVPGQQYSSGGSGGYGMAGQQAASVAPMDPYAQPYPQQQVSEYQQQQQVAASGGFSPQPPPSYSGQQYESAYGSQPYATEYAPQQQQGYTPQYAPEGQYDQQQDMGSSDAMEPGWDDLLANPGAYWDNRLTKKNPKAPDFKHKASGAALWLNSAPGYAQERLAELDFTIRKG